jgi:hypothetical protein
MCGHCAAQGSAWIPRSRARADAVWKLQSLCAGKDRSATAPGQSITILEYHQELAS